MKSRLRYIMCVWAFTLSGVYAFAQQPAGYVHVETRNGPQADAYIYFRLLKSKDADKTSEQHTIRQQLVKADKNGICAIPFAGRMYIHVYAIGYKSIDDTITGDGTTRHIILYPLTVQLNEYTVTTGQYQERTTDQSVYNTTVITAQQMQQRGDNNLTDALSNQLNIRIDADQILGSQISMQGLSGQDVKILMDGVPVIGRNNGYIDISQLNLNNIERIEIVQGPMSVVYGTDAMGGVINLITKKQFQHPLEVYAHGQVSTTGVYDFDGGANVQTHNTTIAINGGRNFFAGYPVFNDSIRAQTWFPKEQLFGGVSAAHTFNKLTLRLRTQYFDETVADLGTPVITPFAATAQDLYFYTTRWDNSLTATLKLNNNANLDMVASYNYYKYHQAEYSKDMVKLVDTLAANNEQDTTTFKSLLMRAVYSYNNPTHKLNYQLGVDIDNESVRGSDILNEKRYINDEALFASLEWNVTPHTIIRPGVRESINSRFGNTIGFLDNTRLTPVLPSLNIRQDLFKNTFVRLSLARGYRAPSLKELYLNFVQYNHDIQGNDQLGAETSNHADVQVAWRHQFGRLYIKTEPSVFYNNLHNGIVLVQQETGTIDYKYENLYHYITKGYTAPLYISYSHLNAALGFTRTGLYDTLKNAQAAHPFTYTNEWKSSVDYSFTRTGIVVSIYYKHTGRTTAFAMINNQITSTYTNPYDVMDASLSKKFLHKRLTLTGGVKNIFNVTDVFSSISTGPHDGSTLYVSPGRSVFIDARINLYTNKK